MSLANLSSPNYTGAELASRANALLTEARGSRRFATVAALLADATMAYGTGLRPVAAGDRVVTAEGFDYQVVAAATTAFTVATAGGVRLRPLRCQDGSFSAAQWGAKGDGVADDAAAIQAAIDYATYGAEAEARGTVRLPPGKFRITRTIHLGYGTNFSAITLEGAGYRYRGLGSMNGTVLIPTFSDRPCLNVQGARGTRIRGLGLDGPFDAYVDANGMGGSSMTPLVDDTQEANWNDPSLAATFDSRYAPFAGICIDGYSGPRPATSYPDVAYPSFLGTVAQYGKAYSSDVVIEDCYIQGFAVGVVVQPCDADGNGDFVVLRDSYIEKCKWIVSVGNTQSRNVDILNVKASRFYGGLTNRRHGRRRGKFGGAVTDMTIFGGINILDFDGAYAGPMTVTNMYAESVWRLGDISHTSPFTPSYSFKNCEFRLSGQMLNSVLNAVRGVPAAILGSDGGLHPGAVTIDGCTFYDFPSVGMFDVLGLEVTGGTQFLPHGDAGQIDKLYEKAAYNATMGGLVVRNLDNVLTGDLRVQPFNLDTGAREGLVARSRRWTRGSRRTCIPWYPESFGAELDEWDQVPNRGRWFRRAFAKSSLAACAIDGRSLTITFAARSEADFLLFGPLPGDVLFDDRTGTVFFVFDRTGTTVKAQAQTNYKPDGAGGFVLRDPFSVTLGNLYYRSSRFYTTPWTLRADATAASATLTAVARDDGYKDWFDAEIAVGDAVTVIDRQDRWLQPTEVVIAGRDQAAGTITLTGFAGLRAATRRRLEMFARQAPANEAAP